MVGRGREVLAAMDTALLGQHGNRPRRLVACDGAFRGQVGSRSGTTFRMRRARSFEKLGLVLLAQALVQSIDGSASQLLRCSPLHRLDYFLVLGVAGALLGGR